jgi:Restriction endonuclease
MEIGEDRVNFQSTPLCDKDGKMTSMSSSDEGRVFAFKLRPQGNDGDSVLRVALDHKIVFVGYPKFRDGVSPDPRYPSSCLLDPRKHLNLGRSVSLIRNIILSSQETNKKMALVARPKHGVVYAARMGDFEIIDNAPWLAAVETIDPSPEFGLEFVQVWGVEEWYPPIAYGRLPAWLVDALRFRNLVREIGSPTVHSTYDTILGLVEGVGRQPRAPTSDPAKIHERLLEDLTPAAFEHLIVAMLQAEHPEWRCLHIGGTGDGGVDAIGVDDQGTVRILVQCKFRLDGDPFALVDERRSASWSESRGESLEVIVASLVHDDGIPHERGRTRFWNKDKIIELVMRHRERLPIATTLRISG